MDAAVWGFIGVVVGGLVTGGVALLTEKLRGDNDAKLDSAKRENDRWIERERFQFQTLIELQGAIRAIRATSWKVYVTKSQAVRSQDTEDVARFNDASEEYRAASDLLGTLAPRIDNQEIWTVTNQLLDDAMRTMESTNEDEALKASEQSALTVRAANLTIGELMRTTYAKPPA